MPGYIQVSQNPEGTTEDKVRGLFEWANLGRVHLGKSKIFVQFVDSHDILKIEQVFPNNTIPLLNNSEYKMLSPNISWPPEDQQQQQTIVSMSSESELDQNYDVKDRKKIRFVCIKSCDKNILNSPQKQQKIKEGLKTLQKNKILVFNDKVYIMLATKISQNNLDQVFPDRRIESMGQNAKIQIVNMKFATGQVKDLLRQLSDKPQIKKARKAVKQIKQEYKKNAEQCRQHIDPKIIWLVLLLFWGTALFFALTEQYSDQ